MSTRSRGEIGLSGADDESLDRLIDCFEDINTRSGSSAARNSRLFGNVDNEAARTAIQEEAKHGMGKIIGFPAYPAYANVQPFSLVGAAGFIELIGGALLIVGLWTRLAAFIVSGEMACDPAAVAVEFVADIEIDTGKMLVGKR